MESQFSMVLMEAAMKIASFTDASIFLLIDTPEGRSWVGRKNLKEEIINGRMQIRPNDVEYDVNPKYEKCRLGNSLLGRKWHWLSFMMIPTEFFPTFSFSAFPP